MDREITARDAALLFALTLAAVFLHGYHLGTDDQAIYLPAIKFWLDPSSYPLDAEFFLMQTRWMLFPNGVTGLVRATHVPLDAALFAIYLASTFLFLFGCLKLARRCFSARGAQWAALLAVWALRPLPVTSTGITLLDGYVTPRDSAVGLILLAWDAALDRKPRCLAWLVLAGLIHPTMAAFGAFHIFFQVVEWPAGWPILLSAALLLPGAPPEAWQQILELRTYLFPLKWAWYSWVGVLAPLAILFWFAQLAKRRGEKHLERVSRRIALSGTIGVLGALLITTVPVLLPLVPTEPMRVLHLVYVLLALLGGGFIGQFVLRTDWRRWALFFLPLCAAMFMLQRANFSHSPHIEWPGRLPANEWVAAFDWARQNTPRGALFSLDPRYMRRPGNDLHGFRAFAERSMMADGMKDQAVAALAPDVALMWLSEVRARERWEQFRREDLLELKRKYRVGWVVVERPGVPGLLCPYANTRVMVCRIE